MVAVQSEPETYYWTAKRKQRFFYREWRAQEYLMRPVETEQAARCAIASRAHLRMRASKPQPPAASWWPLQSAGVAKLPRGVQGTL